MCEVLSASIFFKSIFIKLEFSVKSPNMFIYYENFTYIFFCATHNILLHPCNTNYTSLNKGDHIPDVWGKTFLEHKNTPLAYNTCKLLAWALSLKIPLNHLVNRPFLTVKQAEHPWSLNATPTTLLAHWLAHQKGGTLSCNTYSGPSYIHVRYY